MTLTLYQVTLLCPVLASKKKKIQLQPLLTTGAHLRLMAVKIKDVNV